MSESAYGGESAWGWDRGLNYSEPRTTPEPQRSATTKPQGEIPKQTVRVIRGPQETKQEEPIYDIGELRKQVMEELYDEFYAEIKNDVREELLKEKPVIVREITDELREKLKADLRKSFIKGEGGGR